jgi:MFS family permease
MYREWRIGVSVAAIMAMRGNPVMDHASRSQHQTQADASSISSTNPTASSPLPTQTPPWGALWVMALGLAMIVLDSSIVNVSIPTIIDDIGINLTDAQWVTSLYNIVLAALLLPFGKLGDARGRKLVFQVGTVIFVASSTLAAASQGAGMLLAARVLQGIGGAMIMPNTLSTVSALFRGKYRAAAFGVWGSARCSVACSPRLWDGVGFSW